MATSQIVYLEYESVALKGNPLGDAHQRRLPVYLPPDYEDGSQRRYPVVWMLSGYTGWGEQMLNLAAWDENIQQRLDRLIGQEQMPPVIVALPDCFTRYGGSQYLNSEATGRYEDYVVEELVPFVDSQLRTLPEAAHRAVMGKSSGGYGSMVLGMRHADVFGALACHSGDMMFEYCYRNDFPKFVNGIAAIGGSKKFLEAHAGIAPQDRGQSWFDAISILAMSACYSPNPESELGFDLPCDEYTGEIVDDVWRRWLAWDPVRMVEMVDAYADALRDMRYVFFDCGNKDEFSLHLGARLMTRKMDALNIEYEYEEFDGGHFNIAYRYDTSLPKLLDVIASA